MRSLSAEAKEKLADNSTVLLKAGLALADGTEAELSGDDFMSGTAGFSHATSSSGSFDIGAAVMGSFSATLKNWDGKFDGFDFTDAVIKPSVGVALDDGTVEWLAMGTYHVDQPDSYGNTIGLKCLDNLHLLEMDYSGVPTPYPAPLGVIVDDACTACGLSLESMGFDGHDIIVPERPSDDMTCLAVVSYAAQASGNYVRALPDGRIALEWYDQGAFEEEDWLNGETFDDATPYASGDTADGGSFLDYGSGDNYDGGMFVSSRYAVAIANSSLSVFTDDVVITGVRVTASDEVRDDGSRGEDGETALFGEEGYVLSMEGNPLIAFGQAASIARHVGSKVVGMAFRPFTLTAVGSPAIEAGDPIAMQDSRQKVYRSFITSYEYKLGSYASASCNAESPGRNRASSYSAATEAVVKLRKEVKREVNARELAVEELARKVSESSGSYMTDELQLDGSHVYYMHDKPVLADSKVRWRFTTEAFAISLDYGKTWPYGLDASGTAIMDRIYTIGLDADYIKTGRIASKDGKSFWDLKNNLLTTEGMIANNITAKGNLSSETTLSRVTISGGNISFTGKKDNSSAWAAVGQLIAAYRATMHISSSGYVSYSLDPTLLFLTSTGKARFSVSDGECYLGFPMSPENTSSVYAGDLKTGILVRGTTLLLSAIGGEINFSTPSINFSNHTLKNAYIDTANGGALKGISGTYTFLLSGSKQVTLTIRRGMIVSS